MTPKNNIFKILLLVVALIIISVCTVIYAEKLKTVINQIHQKITPTQNEVIPTQSKVTPIQNEYVEIKNPFKMVPKPKDMALNLDTSLEIQTTQINKTAEQNVHIYKFQSDLSKGNSYVVTDLNNKSVQSKNEKFNFYNFNSDAHNQNQGYESYGPISKDKLTERLIYETLNIIYKSYVNL